MLVRGRALLNVVPVMVSYMTDGSVVYLFTPPSCGCLPRHATRVGDQSRLYDLIQLGLVAGLSSQVAHAPTQIDIEHNRYQTDGSIIATITRPSLTVCA